MCCGILTYTRYTYIYIVSAGEDYEALHENLAFPISSEDEARLCFNISLYDDDTVEGDQYFLVHVESEENVVIHLPYSTIHIHDDDSRLTGSFLDTVAV